MIDEYDQDNPDWTHCEDEDLALPLLPAWASAFARVLLLAVVMLIAICLIGFLTGSPAKADEFGKLHEMFAEKLTPATARNPGDSATTATEKSANLGTESIRADADSPDQFTKDGRSAESRPVIFFYTASWCGPCQVMKQRIESGEFPEFRFAEVDMTVTPASEAWVAENGLGLPLFVFVGRDGGKRWIEPHKFPGTGQLRRVLGDAWRKFGEKPSDPANVSVSAGKRRRPNPGPSPTPVPTPSPSPAPHPSPTSPSELISQFARFGGTSGRFDFSPASPVKATMDNGYILSFKQIAGSYQVDPVRNTASLTIDADKYPNVAIKKLGFIWINAKIQGAELDASSKPAMATLDTDIKKLRVELKEVK